MKWKLMDNAITADQRKKLANFILTKEKFSQGKYVKKFEDKWSEWQGCKYSVFVNSGSSANFLAVHASQPDHYTSKTNSLWVSQACTWSTTVSPIILSKNNLQLCDVSIPNLTPDLDCLEYIFKEYKPHNLFLAHLLGFSAISEELLNLCNNHNVTLLEDCCEAAGATYKDIKVGNFGKISTFSFYYGHHMTTIEGGMVCTDDEQIYEKLLLLRSHGLLRELPTSNQKKYNKVDDNFTFVTAGFNLRSSELNAYLGLLQLENLDKHNTIRKKNFEIFANNLDSSKYFTEFLIDGNCSFCFPVIVKDKCRDKIQQKLNDSGIETRPIIGGNLYEHPFMENQCAEILDKNAQTVHTNGFYIGNNHNVKQEDVTWLVNILNE